jgi:ketosteroid isomerase-like protein
MGQRNVELVKELQPSGVDMIAAVGSGQVEPFGEMPPELFSEDFEAEFFGLDTSSHVAYQGTAGLIEGWRDWLEAWESYEIEAEEFIDAGDKVVAFVRIRGRTRRGGVEMEHAPAAVWTLRDGVVCRIAFHLDRDEALASAGLR